MSINLSGVSQGKHCFDADKYFQVYVDSLGSFTFDKNSLTSWIDKANSEEKGLLIAAQAGKGIKFDAPECKTCPECEICEVCPKCSNTWNIIAIILAVIILIIMIYFFLGKR